MLCLGFAGCCWLVVEQLRDPFPLLAKATVISGTAAPEAEFSMLASTPDDCMAKLDTLRMQAAERYAEPGAITRLSCVETATNRVLLYVNRIPREIASR